MVGPQHSNQHLREKKIFLKRRFRLAETARWLFALFHSRNRFGPTPRGRASQRAVPTSGGVLIYLLFNFHLPICESSSQRA
jgi:hypothetical protein